MHIAFVYDDHYGNHYPIEAWVEWDENDNGIVELEGCDQVSTHLYKCIEQKALELADELRV